MKCPYCHKDIVRKFKMKDYTAMIEKLRLYDGKNLKTGDIAELLKEFYSPTTSIGDITLVKKGIIKKVGFGLYLIDIPKKGN